MKKIILIAISIVVVLAAIARPMMWRLRGRAG